MLDCRIGYLPCCRFSRFHLTHAWPTPFLPYYPPYPHTINPLITHSCNPSISIIHSLCYVMLDCRIGYLPCCRSSGLHLTNAWPSCDWRGSLFHRSCHTKGTSARLIYLSASPPCLLLLTYLSSFFSAMHRSQHALSPYPTLLPPHLFPFSSFYKITRVFRISLLSWVWTNWVRTINSLWHELARHKDSCLNPFT